MIPMAKDESFLRKQIENALGQQKVKYMRELNGVQVHDVCNAGVDKWKLGGMRGIDAVKFAIAYAKSTYKKTR